MIDLKKIYEALSTEINLGLESDIYNIDDISEGRINYEKIINNVKPNCPDLAMFVDCYDEHIIRILIDRITAQYEMVDFKFVSDNPKQINNFYNYYVGNGVKLELIGDDDYVMHCTRYFFNNELKRFFPENIIEQY